MRPPRRLPVDAVVAWRIRKRVVIACRSLPRGLRGPRWIGSPCAGPPPGPTSSSTRRRTTMAADANTRTERDSMGPMEVPAEAYYGASTAACRRELPDLRTVDPPRAHQGAGVDQGLRGGREPAAGRDRPAPARRDRRRRRGGGGQHPRPALRRRRLPDWLGNLVEHERQRGDREPGDRAPRRRARLQGPGAPQRPRERRAVVQRRLPLRRARGRLRGLRRGPCCRRSTRCTCPCRPRRASSPTW